MINNRIVISSKVEKIFSNKRAGIRKWIKRLIKYSLKCSVEEKEVVRFFIVTAKRAGYYTTIDWEVVQFKLFVGKLGERTINDWKGCIVWCFSGKSGWYGVKRSVSSISVVAQAMNDYLVRSKTVNGSDHNKIRSKYEGI